MRTIKAAANSGLAKVAVQCSADTFLVNQIWFSVSIPIAIGMVKIATFAKPQIVVGEFNRPEIH